MVKKHSKSMKESGEDDAEMACEDCGQENCQCGPCESCGQMPCACSGGSCGGGCGCGASMGGHGGHGYGGMHGGWAKKKIMLGIGLIAVALLWYAKNTGMLNPAYFWPLVIGLAGIGLLLKGLWLKHHEQQCGCC